MITTYVECDMCATGLHYPRKGATEEEAKVTIGQDELLQIRGYRPRVHDSERPEVES